MPEVKLVCQKCGCSVTVVTETECKDDARARKFCGVEQRTIYCDVCQESLYREVKAAGKWECVYPPTMASGVVDFATDNLGKPRVVKLAEDKRVQASIADPVAAVK